MTTKIRLFVLDDDEDIRFLIKDALELAEIESYEMFETHEDFFKNLDEFVHIAIIDHSLPGDTGMEVMKRLLVTNPLCHVIIISGNVDPNLIIAYQDYGSYRFIRKDDINFTGKLMMAVHQAYRKLKAVLDFKIRNLEVLENLKLPVDHDEVRRLARVY